MFIEFNPFMEVNLYGITIKKFLGLDGRTYFTI